MLKYISKILRDAPNTHLHNALYNMLNDSTFRENIMYNPKSDKFEIPCSKINAHTEMLLKEKAFGSIEKALEGTNIYIEIWCGIVSFWLE